MQPQTPPPAPRGFIRRNLPAVLGIGAVALAGLAWLAFGYFGIHTAFIDDKVEEAGPVFASGVTADDAGVDPEPAPADEGDADQTGGEAAETGGDEPAAAEPDPVTADSGQPADDATDESGAEEGTGEVVTLAAGTFSGLSRYSGSGDALVLNDGSEQRFLRFENFETSNGPDLNVYLAVGGDVDAGFVDLGDLKGNIGSQNYEIPPEVDLATYRTVQIWCERFGVLFGDAPLA